MTATTKSWRKLARGLARDDNPLRRRSDRIESWLLPVTIALFVALAPVAGIAAAMWVRSDAAAAHQAQRSWHRVPAVLLAAAPGPLMSDGHANGWLVWTRARWTADGKPRSGNIPAPSGTAAGRVVTLWLDSSGRVQRPPSTAGEINDRVLTAAFAAAGLLAVGLTGLAVAVQYVLNWRRLADWEAAWRSVGPHWSRAD